MEKGREDTAVFLYIHYFFVRKTATDTQEKGCPKINTWKEHVQKLIFKLLITCKFKQLF